MQVQSVQARFYETLGPLGVRAQQRSMRMFRLKAIVGAAGRRLLITAKVVLIHVATLRDVF